MTDSKTSPDKKASLNWSDIVLRAVIPGLLLAIAGFVGEWVITSSSSKAENARLVTDLQIQREQAESDLRKDICGEDAEDCPVIPCPDDFEHYVKRGFGSIRSAVWSSASRRSVTTSARWRPATGCARCAR